MTATGHAVLGAVIAAKVANPALAIPIALVSHVAADLFPHWDSGTNGQKKNGKRMFVEASIDVVLGFIIAYSIVLIAFPKTNLLYVFLIILMSQALDWFTAPYFVLGFKFAPFSWFHSFQSAINTKLDKPWGIIDQVSILLLIVVVARFF